MALFQVAKFRNLLYTPHLGIVYNNPQGLRAPIQSKISHYVMQRTSVLWPSAGMGLFRAGAKVGTGTDYTIDRADQQD